jgi:hypothetical protein
MVSDSVSALIVLFAQNFVGAKPGLSQITGCVAGAQY